MATATGKIRCVTCDKEKAIFKCGGCQKDFCYKHSADHRQELSKQLDEVEVTRDLFRQTLTEQIQEPQKNSLIQQIDKWERDSIEVIRRTAEKARQELLKHTDGHIQRIETALNRLTDQLRRGQEENDFVEIDLQRWEQELTQLTNQLAEPSNIRIRQDSTPLVTEISVNTVTAQLLIPCITTNARWIQNAVTVAGGNGDGIVFNQLHMPWGLYVDDEQTVYVADWGNHGIMEWKYGATYGQVVAGGNGPGNRTDQLTRPTDVIVDKEKNHLIICDWGNNRVTRWPRHNGTNGEIIISDIDCCGITMDVNGHLYISDYSKHEVRRWREGDTCGTVIAGNKERGKRFDQLNCPTYVFVDHEQSVYVSDSNNHRVMKWKLGAKKGILVAGGPSSWNNLPGSSHPRGVAVDQVGTIYVIDSNNHQVIRWSQGAEQGRIVIGDKGKGDQSNQLKYPRDLSFDRHGNLYIADQDNHRVQRFDISFSSYTP